MNDTRATRRRLSARHRGLRSGPMPAVHRFPTRPAPELAQRIVLTLPGIPEAMVGTTVLHITDLHVRRYRPWFRSLVRMCSRIECDFVFMTGDYMSWPGDERPALRVLRDLIDVLNPRHGIYGSFGNHDFEAFKRLASQVPGATFLEHDAVVIREMGVTLLGTSTPGDLVTTIDRAHSAEAQAGVPSESMYRILLGHEPSLLIVAADFGIQWALLGHTHGGQIRLGLNFALHNSSRLPMSHSSGILRLRDTIGTVSRGLGESYVDFRFLCAPQLPLYELRRGPLPGAYCRKMECVRWW